MHLLLPTESAITIVVALLLQASLLDRLSQTRVAHGARLVSCPLTLQ